MTKELVPGCRIRNSFCQLDENGHVNGFLTVEGEYLGCVDGYARIRYRRADLPKRTQERSTPLEEFVVLQHDGPTDWEIV